MLIIPLIVWIVSLVLLFVEPFMRKHYVGLGLFAFDLWLGLHFLMTSGERITFG